MKNDCAGWKDLLVEAALTGTAASRLDEHLQSCAECSQQLALLRDRRERLDALLPLVARGAELSGDFRARVAAAAEAAGNSRRRRVRWVWALAGAAALFVAAAISGIIWRRTTASRNAQAELAMAKTLADWRAPTDVLLQMPGQEILRTAPKLGESYLNVSTTVKKEQ